jgi:hypothetical protein
MAAAPEVSATDPVADPVRTVDELGNSSAGTEINQKLAVYTQIFLL